MIGVDVGIRALCFILFLTDCFLGTSLVAQESQFDNPPNTQALDIPMTPPDEALKMMELPAGFGASVFAAEPDVHQPISVTTDSRGRLWVAECYTYSDRKENYNTKLNDRIVIFEDTNRDGKFDNKKVFWDKGKKLTSIEVGFGGVWVTAAPNLMFIPDRDQDDVPDGEPEILLNGFEGDVIRHNIVNGLRWGPDGWLYGRHGIQATSFVGEPDATDSQRTPMNCAIWRYHPTHRKFEIVAQGGTNPWGFDFDEHGEMFMINTVIGHLFHVVPNAYYRRMYGANFNPHIYDVIEQTADHFHWDVSEEHWAVTKKEGMSDGTDAAGGGHAHTGLMIYQGGNWPKEFHNKLFTANFHGRRINSDSIHREGNSYVAHHGPDYFKTADPWFRGVELIYGPDGSVYVLDWSDIGECHENDGIHRTSGRIFNIWYETAETREKLNLNKLLSISLIKLLSNKNEWYSRQARRILQERAQAYDEWPSETQGTFKSQLFHAYASAKNPRNQLRLLWTIYSCGLANREWLVNQLKDENEHVRAWVVRLLADGLEDDPPADEFVELARNDSSALVRLYLASSFPRFETEDVLRIADELAKHKSDADDRVQSKLIWSGIEPHVMENPDMFFALAYTCELPLLRQYIARRIASEIENSNAVDTLVFSMRTNENNSNSKEHIATLKDLATGMSKALNGWSQAPQPKSWPETAANLIAFNDPELNQFVVQMNVIFGDGRAIEDLKKLAANGKADIAARRNAFATLAKSKDAPELFNLFKQHLNNKALTNVVAAAMVRCDQPAVAPAILSRFKNMDPEGRSIAVNTLVARVNWAQKLLDAVADNRVASSYISAAHARQIMNFGDDKLTKRLTEVWGDIRQTSAERSKEIETLRGKLSDDALANANLKRGQMLYEKNCASCHTLFGDGGKIGPDLTGSDRKNLNYLLENVIDPSASVAQGFRSSVILLLDGRLVTGVVVRETDRTVAVQTKDDLVSIDKQQIDDIKKTSNSLMPEGLLGNLSDEDVRDLFRYLQK